MMPPYSIQTKDALRQPVHADGSPAERARLELDALDGLCRGFNLLAPTRVARVYLDDVRALQADATALRFVERCYFGDRAVCAEEKIELQDALLVVLRLYRVVVRAGRRDDARAFVTTAAQLELAHLRHQHGREHVNFRQR